jgi:hypothetical protein
MAFRMYTYKSGKETCMDTFKLKVFAISVMLIDHIGAVIITQTNHYWLYLACRAIGRLAFPIFAFLITEGFRKTGNVVKYMKRLFLFALLSEIPFDFALYQYHFNTDVISDIRFIFQKPSYADVVFNRLIAHQNVFFTLFLGLLLIYLFDLIEKQNKKNDFMGFAISNLLYAFLMAAFCLAATWLRTDYDYKGILIIVAFYLFKESKALMTISLFIISFTLLCDFRGFEQTGNWLAMVSIFATLAMIPICFYNGKKGKSIKYFFYAFYPVHLMCLFLFTYFFKLL